METVINVLVISILVIPIHIKNTTLVPWLPTQSAIGEKCKVCFVFWYKKGILITNIPITNILITDYCLLNTDNCKLI